MPTEREVWCLTFEAMPSDVPVSARFKALLKIAGRRLGLKCIAVTDAAELALGVPEASGVPFMLFEVDRLHTQSREGQ